MRCWNKECDASIDQRYDAIYCWKCGKSLAEYEPLGIGWRGCLILRDAYCGVNAPLGEKDEEKERRWRLVRPDERLAWHRVRNVEFPPFI